ncbi:hypothetical protein TorRG33x02_048950 [Trema orientale]|uniref:Uncharacterized protein n=1 Tax=Trema orientale TaxID=63057 RepID=A0A2P5FNG9_TREOI|nr:hypothetical protein TorRG33x02_048950 [Trema orientale]
MGAVPLNAGLFGIQYIDLQPRQCILKPVRISSVIDPAAGLEEGGTPPSIIKVEVTNIADCPNFFSKFIWDISISLSSSTATQKTNINLDNLKRTSSIRKSQQTV